MGDRMGVLWVAVVGFCALVIAVAVYISKSNTQIDQLSQDIIELETQNKRLSLQIEQLEKARDGQHLAIKELYDKLQNHKLTITEPIPVKIQDVATFRIYKPKVKPDAKPKRR